jgi:hypothetical protein
MTLTVLWLQRVALAVLVILLVLLGREAATHSVDFPVYHRAARQVIAVLSPEPSDFRNDRSRPKRGGRAVREPKQWWSCGRRARHPTAAPLGLGPVEDRQKRM